MTASEEENLTDNAKLIALLDAAYDLPGYNTFMIFAERFPEGERIFRLWASVRRLALDDTTRNYADGTIRTLNIKLGTGQRGYVRLQWPLIKRPPADAEDSPQAQLTSLGRRA